MDPLEVLIKNRHSEYEIAINISYGGFGLTKEMCEDRHLDWKKDAYLFNNDRSNVVLISLIKKHKPKDLGIIKIELEDIPRAYLRNYDGIESIVYDHCDDARLLMEYLGKRDS